MGQCGEIHVAIKAQRKDEEVTSSRGLVADMVYVITVCKCVIAVHYVASCTLKLILSL